MINVVAMITNDWLWGRGRGGACGGAREGGRGGGGYNLDGLEVRIEGLKLRF